MKYWLRNKKAFTLIELMVSMAIMVIMFTFASVIFNVSINSHRAASANNEIMQKLRAITSQLNTDFKGLNKNGEILVIWDAKPLADTNEIDNDLDGYERFDRIMFFANGDFQSYRTNPVVRGNTARICYMIARQGGRSVVNQEKNERILARTQHILTADTSLTDLLDPSGFTNTQWQQWNNEYEYDKTSLEQWKLIPWGNKLDMLSVITDVTVSGSNIDTQYRGAIVDPADANSIHLLLCQGVGEFKIQGWDENRQQWIPEVDPDEDGNITDDDTHFLLNDSDPNKVPGVLYPYPPNGFLQINNIDYPREQINKKNFNNIPGLGRALKFTFTLYDSKGIIEEGRTFTHIVYLDD
ncbi:Tfp pilus assembly protein FimT/FimU [Planctomycetota bacterium]